jgi:hypothetical protein
MTGAPQLTFDVALGIPALPALAAPLGSESLVDMSLVPNEGPYTHPTINLWDGGHEIWISKRSATHVSFMARQGERTFGRFKWAIAEFMAGRENYIPNK